MQLWPLAKENYLGLGMTQRRRFRLGDFEGAVQFNPARIASTGAKVDAASIKARPCFLCRDNRPECQLAAPFLSDWEVLVNPYPIFPVHYTIADRRHVPQGPFPLDMAAFAEQHPELAVFYNGARAGASAPDHRHMQAVLKLELPIVALTERMHPAAEGGVQLSSQWQADLPFDWYSAVITPDAEGMRTLAGLTALTGFDAEQGDAPDFRLMNVIMWIGENGMLRVIVIPRRRHRPLCYGADRAAGQLMVSPGTIDMAGVIIVPRHEDFMAITDDDIRRIYADVACRLHG